MRIKVRASILKAFLGKANLVASAEGLKNEHQAFCFNWAVDRLVVIKTNLSQYVKVYLNPDCVDVEDDSPPFECLINAEKLLSLVKRLPPDADVVLEVVKDKSKLQIKCNNFAGRLTTFKIEQFGEVPVADITKTKWKKMKTQMFCDAIRQVRHAAPPQGYHEQFMNVVFRNKRCWVADSRQLHGVFFDTDVVIVLPLSAASVTEFLRVSASETFELGEDEHYYYFKVGEDLFTTKKGNLKIEDKWTEYLNFLHQERQLSFNIDVEVFRNAVERVSVTAHERDQTITLFCDVPQGHLYLKAMDEMKNESIEMLPVHFTVGSKLKDDKYTRTIWWQFLTEAVSAMGVKQISVRLDKSHVVFVSEQGTAICPFISGKK